MIEVKHIIIIVILYYIYIYATQQNTQEKTYEQTSIKVTKSPALPETGPVNEKSIKIAKAASETVKQPTTPAPIIINKPTSAPIIINKPTSSTSSKPSSSKPSSSKPSSSKPKVDSGQVKDLALKTGISLINSAANKQNSSVFF
jgi:hypothetical protein